MRVCSRLFLLSFFVRALFCWLRRDGFAWYAIFVAHPTAEVHKFTALRTEWPKWIVLPGGGLTAGWTVHVNGKGLFTLPA